MNTATSVAAQPERKLDLRSILRDLQADGLLALEDVERLETTPRTAAQAAMHPLTYLAGQDLPDARRPGRSLDIETLTQWLAGHAGQPYYRIDPLKIDVAAVTEVMSFPFAQRHGILAVSATRDEVTITSAEPFQKAWLANLEHVLRRPIRRVVSNPDDVARFTVEFYTLSRSVLGAKRDAGVGSGLANLEQMLDLGALKDPDANDQHIVNIVDWLFQYAFDQRASDIHIEPRREKGNVRFRIDGVMHTVYQMPMQVLVAVISRIKILGRLNIAEKRRPQDGRLKTRRPDDSEVELRLSTLPTAFGEKLVMRIFDPEVLLRSYKELGLQDKDYERWQGMTSQPNGIVLVTGPTGSGKTTTLYSTLKQLATPEVNLCTIEDPIEMIEPAFNQMQVQHNIELDFASGVRALMRQDPDIIMVGEIRDLETAQMAVQAALTGHLVLSTLHTNDSPSAVSRLLELGVPAYLIKATLLGVMAQRLVRTLCPHCKEAGTVDADAWKQLTRPWQVPLPKQVFKPVGCLDCRNTGYLGRQGLYEILVMNDAQREFVRSDTDLKALRQSAMRDGMRTLRLSGAQKIAQGLTTIEEVMRVAPLADSDKA